MDASKVDITYNEIPELSEDSKQAWADQDANLLLKAA
jgi:hypothetical protein